MNKITLTICLPLVLSGCLEGNMNTKELCASSSALRCEHLNMRDGQCRVPRTDLIWHRKEVLESPTDENKIKEFNYVRAYQKCLDLAAQIEPTKIGDKKERRFTALMHTYDEQKRILADLKKSTSPEALYFLWTQGDQSALRQFLKLEDSKKVQTPELQYALATYYATRDREKSIRLLNNALRLSDGEDLNINIIESLASTNHFLKRKEHAYIWVLVGKEFDLPVASERNLMVLYNFSDEKKEKLQKTAERIVDAIKDGKYRSALLPRY
ncbi:DUF2989 domain-containing protein [Vibrio sp. SCSIO 43137]|uniref:DUF2989 domain-containing protein n=1 Tax=Vibrio sp. SCSIO 43137 TaxID=3021011 RepID=UPI00230811E0|nr:DUF2989 domain-containing protein [Vibrio sp. SCSIO 43137]WCE30658.1 DUF2989 domain-containing protein [Vibrio sp. SCSIO 43137]